MTSRLLIEGQEVDPVVGNNGANSSYLVRNFKDPLYDVHSGQYAKQQKYSQYISPNSGLGAVFNGNSTTIQWDIVAPSIDHFESMQLRMLINNPSGANIATLLPAHYCINYIEIICGSQTQTLYPHDLMFQQLFLAKDDNDVFNNRAFSNGYAGGIAGNAYTNPATLAVSTSRVVYLDIPNWITKTKVFVPAIKNNIQLKIEFAANATTSASAQQVVTLTEADLHIAGIMYSPDIKQRLVNRYKMFDTCLAYYEGQVAIKSGQPLSATSKSNISISNFAGYKIPFICSMIVPNGATREDLYNFQAALVVEYERNGTTLLNYNNADIDWVRMLTAKKFFTTAPASNLVYILQAADHPVLSADYGLQSGSIEAITVNDSISIQSSASNTFNVVLLTYRYACALIKKDGTVELQRT